VTLIMGVGAMKQVGARSAGGIRRVPGTTIDFVDTLATAFELERFPIGSDRLGSGGLMSRGLTSRGLTSGCLRSNSPRCDGVSVIGLTTSLDEVG
jgi:hypothetical protein